MEVEKCFFSEFLDTLSFAEGFNIDVYLLSYEKAGES